MDENKNIFSLLSLNELKKWAQSNSLWFYTTGSACCANEMLQVQSCKYDLERLGITQKLHPEQADVLIIYGAVTKKAKPALLEVYSKMKLPKRVVAVGACACSGGLFRAEDSTVIENIEDLFNVDVYIPGCPPRPEAIMNGLLLLKEKILNEEA